MSLLNKITEMNDLNLGFLLNPVKNSPSFMCFFSNIGGFDNAKYWESAIINIKKSNIKNANTNETILRFVDTLKH